MQQTKELKIDPELRDLLPPLTEDEYKQLEKNIVDNGFDKNFPIMEWNGFIVDGHNRYSICKKHNIEYVVGSLAYKTKEEVMEWMLDIQLGRRNLTPIQRIAVAEKYREFYEKQAKENLKTSTGGLNPQPLPNSVKPENKIDTTKKLAEVAGVGKETYRQAKRILDSDNEELKQEVLSGEKSINAGYKELTQKNQESLNISQDSNIQLHSPASTVKNTETTKSLVSDEVRQICEDLKIEKSKEYLDSIWDYKISVIECMNADFEMYYDGFVSILHDMEDRVTKEELNECIKNAEALVKHLLEAIEDAKNIKVKLEEQKNLC